MIRLVFHKRTCNVDCGPKRLFITSAIIHILRRQKMLLERHHSIDPNCTWGPAMLAIYEATYYQISFVNLMIRDGIDAPAQYRFVLERLRAVQPHKFFEGFVGGKQTFLAGV